MADPIASPNTDNYAVLKGNVYFTKTGGTRRHLGNCTQLAVTPEVEKLDHFSSMAGVKSKDKSVVIQKTLTLTLNLEEITLDNLQLALFGGDIAAADGEATTDGGNDRGFDIFAVSEITGVLEVIGSNDIGPKYNARFPNVSFSPDGGIDLIGDDDWAALQVSAEALYTDGTFGRMWLQDSAVTTGA
jgi:hypothetical protein